MRTGAKRFKRWIWALLMCSSLAMGQGTDVQKVHLLERIGYGPTTKSLRELDSMSIDRWVDLQLQAPYPDDRVKALVAPLAIHQDLFHLYRDHDETIEQSETDDASQEYREHADMVEQNFVQRADYALYSENRLREAMVAFWFNHFNIGPYSDTTSAAFLNDYETMLRANALGNFRTLLGAVAHHPAMLNYLDNTVNVKDGSVYFGRHVGVNENYARELMELHTLGVNGGYTQKDVVALAKILTGFGMFCYCNYDEKDLPRLKALRNYKDLQRFVAHAHPDGHYVMNDDYFLFDADVHDFSNKVLLGHTIHGDGYQELDEALDMLADAPQTAHFISQKLAVYFLSDDPPADLVRRMATTFESTHGDIKSVLKVLLDSPEFRASLNGHPKYKDLYTYELSTIKTMTDGQVVSANDLRRLGQGLAYVQASPYSRDTPEGLSLYGRDWQSSNRLMEELRFAHQMVYAPQYVLSTPFTVHPALWRRVAQRPITNPAQLFRLIASSQWLER